MKNSTISIALLTASLFSNAAVEAQSFRAATARRSVPKTALLVLVENGGIRANFAECKVGTRSARLPKIPVASCGSLCFALNPGENVAGMVRRAARVINRNRGCTNPRNWKVEMLSFDQWFTRSTDFLLEELTKSIQMLQRANSKYGTVVVLEDDRFKPKLALAQMRRLAAAGYTVDIHVLAHGGNEAFYGGGNAKFNEGSFFAPARGIRGLKLRSVYQMNCVSGTLMDDWLKLGAKVVNGTYGKKNNYMPQSYFHFSGKWLNGEDFGAAVLASYQEARLYTEPVYRRLGLAGYVTDSRMRVMGDFRCDIGLSNPIAKVVKRGKKTVQMGLAALCTSYKNAKKTAAQACKLLLDAGHELAEVATELRKQYGLSNENLCKALKTAGCTANQVAICMTKTMAATMRINARELTRCMLRAGYSVQSVATELKRVCKRSSQHIASYLRQAGCSSYNLALVLNKTLKCSIKNTARYMLNAGCSATQVARALNKKLKCGLGTVTTNLFKAGASFNKTAKAAWSISKKKASSINIIANALAKAAKQNIAQVMGNLAKLGIK